MQATQEKPSSAITATLVVERIARDYIADLKPGDYFSGIAYEASKRFDIGSIGYDLFVNTAMQEFGKIVMDVDKYGRIVSIAANPEQRSKVERRAEARKNVESIKQLVIRQHNEKVTLLAACRAVDRDVEQTGTVSEKAIEAVREAIKFVEGK